MKIFTIAYLLAFSSIEATVSLNNLIDSDKISCLEELEKAPDATLWDVFLEGQSQLFFDSEFSWIEKGIWWKNAKNILEIGCGNGSYLSKLSNQFQNNCFRGIEKLEQPVKQANERYANAQLVFQEGDAEVFDDQLVDLADIVLFRLTLQHLKDPITALKHAAKYLSSNGHIVIIDSYDPAKKTSHPIPAIDDAMDLVAEIQNKAGKGNRKVTLELLQALESNQSPLSNLYEVVSSNLDIHGNVVGDTIYLQGEKNRLRLFNHNLLILTLFQRTYQIPVDLSTAYDQLQDYLNDVNAWTSIGVHFLVLKKKDA